MAGRFRRRGFRARTFFVADKIPVLAAALLSICFLRYASEALRPMIETVAISRATNLISMTISRVADECLLQSGMEYSDFISTEKGLDGSVTALAGNPAQCSRIKRQIVERIGLDLNHLSSNSLSVPIGDLTGHLLLLGYGPKICVNVYSVGEIVAAYRSTLTSAGINQTLHGVYLDIVVTVYLLIPGGIVPVTVSDSVCIAESMILGDVPDVLIQPEEGVG